MSLSTLRTSKVCKPRQTKLCGRKDCKTCFERSVAHHAPERSKHWSKKNGEVEPWAVCHSSAHPKRWFDCDVCPHSFDASPSNVCRNHSWCPYCANKKLCECNTCFQKSFAYHHPNRSRCWSKKNTVTPDLVLKASNTTYLFDCDVCGHEFSMTPNEINNQGQWCPYCCVPSIKICGDKGCDHCFKKSFAYHAPEQSKCWSDKNTMAPWAVLYGSKTKRIFNCDVCHHKFKLCPNSITAQGQWCQYCNGHKLCTKKCDICFNKSFASHKRSQYWSTKNKTSPRHVTKCCNERYLFNCDVCLHEFWMRPNDIVSQDQWCPKCQFCPSCGLWRTCLGRLCRYCKPKNINKEYTKTKEYQVVKFLKDALPDLPFTHNKSVGKECTDGHLFPDIRYDCTLHNREDDTYTPYFLIVEVDEFQHRGASYKCDQQRMYDIVAKLGAPCIFIRYNPDTKEKDSLKKLALRVKNNAAVKSPVWDDTSGLKVIYLFYNSKKTPPLNT
jgi:Probable Zinc-ribbon domain